MSNYLNAYIQGLLNQDGKAGNLSQNLIQQGQQQVQDSMRAKNTLQNQTDSLQSMTDQQVQNAIRQQQSQGSALGNFIRQMGLDALTGGIGGTASKASNAVNPTYFLKT